MSDPSSRSTPRQLIFQIGFIWNSSTSRLTVTHHSDGTYPVSFVLLEKTPSAQGSTVEVFKSKSGLTAYDCLSGDDNSSQYQYQVTVGDQLAWEIFDLCSGRPLSLSQVNMNFSTLTNPPRACLPVQSDEYQAPQGAKSTGEKACPDLPGAGTGKDSVAHPYWTPPSGAMTIENAGSYGFTINFDIECEKTGEKRSFMIDPEMIVSEADSGG